MEENSEASNNNNYPEEVRELGIVALNLVTMKYLEVDSQTANDLNIMKTEVLGNGEHKVDVFLPINENFMEEIKNGSELKQPQFGQTVDGLNPPKFPPINNLRGVMGCCSVPFEKQLTESDVRADQSRLTIPKDLFEEFLKPLMDESESKELNVEGIPVTTYDSKGNMYPMTFKIWSSKTRVLTKGWKKFYLDHELKALQDWVTIWMFRHNQTDTLCFVIMARRFPIYKLLSKSVKTVKKRKHEEME